MCFKSAFKASPMEFMRKNIVVSPLENPGLDKYTNKNTVKLSIAAYPEMQVANKPDGGVYKIVFEDSEHAIEAYWCPYHTNDVGSVTLGTDAKWVFTAAMSGCSFGIGARALDGTLRISHANSKNSSAAYGISTPEDVQPAMDQQRRVQRHFLAEQHSINKVVNYKHYMGDGDNFDTTSRSTTFGELPNVGGVWNFYTLKYTQKYFSVHGDVHGPLFGGL